MHKNSKLTNCKVENSESIVALIDIDCFECQWLEREHPHLRGLPFAAVRLSRGLVSRFSSVNYQARSLGVSRLHTYEEALQLCPSLQLASLPRNQETETLDPSPLKNAAAEIFESIKTFAKNNFVENSYTIKFSPNDEFYVDLTQQVDKHKLDIQARLEVCRSIVIQMVQHIFQETGFTCSAGVSTSSFRAKLAAEQDRPSGVSILHPNDWDAFLASRHITSIPGLKGKLGKRLVDKFEIQKMTELKLIGQHDLESIGGLKEKELRIVKCIFAGD